MGLPEGTEAVSTETHRDASGLDRDGYDNYPLTDDLAKYVYFMSFSL